jgi:hypothetical protein
MQERLGEKAIGVINSLLLWRWKLPEPALIAAAAIIGVFLYKG